MPIAFARLRPAVLTQRAHATQERSEQPERPERPEQSEQQLEHRAVTVLDAKSVQRKVWVLMSVLVAVIAVLLSILLKSHDQLDTTRRELRDLYELYGRDRAELARLHASDRPPGGGRD